MELLRPSFSRLIKAIHHNILSHYYFYRANELKSKGKKGEQEYFFWACANLRNLIDEFLYKDIPHPVFVYLQKKWQKLGFNDPEEASAYCFCVAAFPGRTLGMNHEELDSTLSIKKILSLYPISNFRRP
jgi:hypothetical protein